MKVVETFEKVHLKLNLPIYDDGGFRMLGGHSMRLTGARLLSSSGMHLYQVELMARWKSPMLIHYAQSAPLAKITQEFQQAKEGTDLSSKLDVIRKQMDELRTTPSASQSTCDMEPRLAKLENDLTALDARTKHMIKEEITQVRQRWNLRPADFIFNNSSRTWHIVGIDGIGHHPETWTTKCGWKFGFAKFTRSLTPPSVDARRCDKCWPPQSDSSSTDSSSDSEA